MNLCQVFSCCFKPSMVSERTSRTSDDSDSRYDPTNSLGTPPEYKFKKLPDTYEKKFLPRTQSASAIPTSTDL
ncbi:hypothetical protein CL647_06420 [bacterium]|nr:hypothetical protein [bacterium]